LGDFKTNLAPYLGDWGVKSGRETKCMSVRGEASGGKKEKKIEIYEITKQHKRNEISI
jgi:hypothetical protein